MPAHHPGEGLGISVKGAGHRVSIGRLGDVERSLVLRGGRRCRDRDDLGPLDDTVASSRKKGRPSDHEVTAAAVWG